MPQKLESSIILLELWILFKLLIWLNICRLCMYLDGNAAQLQVQQMNLAQISLITHMIQFQTKLINYLELKFSMTKNKMKQEAE